VNIIGFYKNKIYKILVSRLFTLGFIVKRYVAIGIDVYYLSTGVYDFKEV